MSPNVPDLRAADPQPAHDRPHRHAERQHRQHQQGRRAREMRCGPDGPVPRRGARRRRCGRTWPVPRASRLGDQQHQAQQDQHAGQHAARRAVEGDLELLEDRDGEGVEPHHGERAVLGEQMHADQQPAAEDRQPQLRQHDAEEHARGVGSERAGRFLDGGIEPAQRRGGGQVHEREVRQRRDQHARPQPVQRRDHADPRIAVDEGRNGKRRNEQRTPEAPGRAGRCAPPARPPRRRSPRTAAP